MSGAPRRHCSVSEEATIEGLHRAIRAGQTNCVAIVRHYIERARAFNGVASALVTEDGATIAEATGTVRAMAPLRFPAATVSASTILPEIDKTRRTAARIRPDGRPPRIPACSSNTA